MIRFIISLLVLSPPFAFGFSKKVIYGVDNRSEVYEKPEWQRHASAVAAMVPNYMLKMRIRDEIFLSQLAVGKALGLCKDVRFWEQQALADCSGFLVAPDVLVTAGHCITSQEDCDGYQWVFDYKLSLGEITPATLRPENVYSCQSIINRSGGFLKNDYAVIKLDRASDREPLKLLPVGESVNKNDSLVMIGFPNGIPMKVTDGGKVLSQRQRKFSTNLDAFGGNSGSPVISAETGLVVGILDSGEDDFILEPTCASLNRLTDSKGGEWVTSIKVLPREF